jgi:vacuolar-type H+-ATPase subunit H
MIDLTQKILSLDIEATLELNDANAVSMEAKREADLHAEERMQEAKQLFEKQKNSEVKQLAKNIEDDRKRAIDNVQQKMETFDKNVKIDKLVEHLLTVTKDRICR